MQVKVENPNPRDLFLSIYLALVSEIHNIPGEYFQY